jgi:hypothetical protein
MSASSDLEEPDVSAKRIGWIARITGIPPAVLAAGSDQPAAHAGSVPVLTPNDIETMAQNDAQAEAFDQLLQAYAARSDAEARDFLLLLALKISNLSADRSAPALRSFLQVVPNRPGEERAALLAALAVQVPHLGMREPGSQVDRLAALSAVEQTTYADLEDPDQQAEVVKLILNGYVQVNHADVRLPQDEGEVAIAAVPDTRSGEEPEQLPAAPVETAQTVPLAFKAIQDMLRGPEQTAAFHKALGADTAEGRELLGLTRTVGWLHTEACLNGLTETLKVVQRRPPADQPELIAALADQVGKFPPQDQDFPEPTQDQVKALQALLETTETLLRTSPENIGQDQRAQLLDELREALGGACGGGMFYGGMLSVEDAVEQAKDTADMSEFLARLNALGEAPSTCGR